MLRLPTRLGTSGTWIATWASARRSSHTPAATASATRMRKVTLASARASTMSAPSVTPTAIAAGRLRPARELLAGRRAAPPPERSSATAVEPSARLSRSARRVGCGEVMAAEWIERLGSSDLEQLGLLALQQVVDGLDVLLRHDVELLLGAGALVLAHLAVLDQAVELVLGPAADVADGDLGVLALVAGQLDVVPAPLLGQLREHAADDVAVVAGVHAEVGVAQGLLDLVHGRLVERRDQDGARLGGLERGQLLQRGGRAVVVDHELVEHAGGGASGADAGEVLLGDLDGLLHLLLGLEQGLVNHVGSFAALVGLVWSCSSDRVSPTAVWSGVCGVERSVGGDERPDLLTADGALHVAIALHAEHD